MKNSEIKIEFDSKLDIPMGSDNLNESSYEEEEDDLSSIEESESETPINVQEMIKSEKLKKSAKNENSTRSLVRQKAEKNQELELEITKPLTNMILPKNRTLFSPLSESLMLSVNRKDIVIMRNNVYDNLVSDYMLNRTAMRVDRVGNYTKSINFMKRNIKYREEKEVRQNVYL